MEEELIFVNFLKIFFIFTAPVVFFVGIFLLYDIEMYKRIEGLIAKVIFFSKKPRTKFINMLEKNRESLQIFLLRRRRIIGLICLINSLLAIHFVSSLLLRR